MICSGTRYNATEQACHHTLLAPSTYDAPAFGIEVLFWLAARDWTQQHATNVTERSTLS